MAGEASRATARKLNWLELKIPPVALALIAAAAMWLAALPSTVLLFELPGQDFAAAMLLLAAFAVGFRGVAVFRRQRTTVNPTTPGAASAIVTTDIYSLTRNPMYLALALALVAWGIFLGSFVALTGVPLFVVYMNLFQIAPEERALAGKFGAAYEAYCRSVRRWL